MNKTTSYTDPSTTNKILSVGIVGAGDVVVKNHLPILLALKEVSVAWVTDVDNKLAKSVAESYKIEWLPLPQKLDKLPVTDILLLAIPYGARAPYFKVLHERQTAIYVEKPFARSVVEHRRLTSFLPPSNMSVGVQRRALGSVKMLRKMFRKRIFGNLNKIEFRHGSSANVFKGKAFSSDPSMAGGGVFFEHGVHGLDLALYISSTTSTHSYKVNTIIQKGFDVHSEGQILFVSPLGEFCFDYKVSWLTEAGEGLTFYFDNMVVYMSIEEARVDFRSLDGDTMLSITDELTLFPTTGFQSSGRFWLDFISAIKNKTENYTTAGSSELTTEVLERVYAQGTKQ
jgi:predicted dehydrogenase